MNKGKPAWLTAKVDQRLAFMAEQFGAAGTTDQMIEAFLKAQPTVLFTPLTEPPENATDAEFERWDRTCDNCGKHCTGRFFTGSVVREKWDTQVIFMFGTCETCKELP